MKRFLSLLFVNRGVNMKKRIIHLALCLLLLPILGLVFIGCTAKQAEELPQNVEIIHDVNAVYEVTSKEELVAFFETEKMRSAKLLCDIAIGDTMLILPASRGAVMIDGGGFTLSGTGSCVLRVDENAEVILKDLTVIGSADALGALDQAVIGGENLVLQGGRHAISGVGRLYIAKDSTLTAIAESGCGISAAQLEIAAGCDITASGALAGVLSSHGSIVIAEQTQVYSESNGYHALKCTGQLLMKNGSLLEVQNIGEYNGAELGSMVVEGAVTIRAQGGEKGRGIFLSELYDDVSVSGFCDPAVRNETGDGKLLFAKEPAAETDDAA